MSMIDFEVNDLFILRIIKSYTTNPSREWSNSYEFVANSAGGIGVWDALISSFVTYEQTLHNTFTAFIRATVSTWQPDSVPYDPDNFISQDLTGNGTRDTTGELEPITTTLDVKRISQVGRQGHIFYRGVLSQADTSAPSGITILGDPTALQAELDAAVAAGGIEGNLIGGPGVDLQLAMINKTGTQIRAVNNLKIGGVSQLPVDHAWFNRTPSS